jgi:hypothetical protein
LQRFAVSGFVFVAHIDGPAMALHFNPGSAGWANPDSREAVIASWQIHDPCSGTSASGGSLTPGDLPGTVRSATAWPFDFSGILYERRMHTLDPAASRAAGIEPEGCRWRVVYSGIHQRAAFRTLANRMIDVETPGLNSSTLWAAICNRMSRPIALLDEPGVSTVSRPGQDPARA